MYLPLAPPPAAHHRAHQPAVHPTRAWRGPDSSVWADEHRGTLQQTVRRPHRAGCSPAASSRSRQIRKIQIRRPPEGAAQFSTPPLPPSPGTPGVRPTVFHEFSTSDVALAAGSGPSSKRVGGRDTPAPAAASRAAYPPTRWPAESPSRQPANAEVSVRRPTRIGRDAPSRAISSVFSSSTFKAHQPQVRRRPGAPDRMSSGRAQIGAMKKKKKIKKQTEEKKKRTSREKHISGPKVRACP